MLVMTARLVALCLLLLATASAQEPSANLPGSLRASGAHARLLGLLERARLLDALRAEGPFTLFAPTDEALRSLPPRSFRNLSGLPDPSAKLKEILLGHVVEGAWTRETLAGQSTLKTLAGTRLEIEAGPDGMSVNGVALAGEPTPASNGMLWELPLLLMPLARQGPSSTTSKMLFPQVSGSSLEREKFALPGDFEAEVNLALVAFAQIQQRSVDTWVPLGKELEASYRGFRYYELPTIQPMNPLMQVFIDRGMAAGIPSKDARERTITLYTPLKPFLAALDLEAGDRDHIHALLVKKDGTILWHARGPLTRAARRQALDFAREHLEARTSD